MSEENNKQTEEMTEDVQEETVAPKTSKKEKGKGLKMIIVLVVLLVALFALYRFGMFGGSAGGADDMAVNPDQVIASVIGTTITRADLDKKIEQVKLSMPPGSADPTEDAAFELQLLQDLIDLELLTSAAEEKNYTVSDDEIDAEISNIVEQFNSEEEFKTQLEAVGITDEELRDNIETEMRIRRLLDEETGLADVAVSDAEIADLYQTTVGDSEDAPPLSEVSEIIRAQLMNQKSATIIDEFVSKLRETADIEINL